MAGHDARKVWRNSHMAISVRRKWRHFWPIFDAQRLRRRRRWPWDERARSARRAFACQPEFTGAALKELARVLRKAGAAEGAGWVVARTLPR
jgi:hypothetical protein